MVIIFRLVLPDVNCVGIHSLAAFTATAVQSAPVANRAFTLTLPTTTAQCAKRPWLDVKSANPTQYVWTVKTDTSSLEEVVQAALFALRLCLAVFHVLILPPAKHVKVDSSFSPTTSARPASVSIVDVKHVVQTEVVESYAPNVHLDFTKTPQQTFALPAQLSDAQFVIRPIQAFA